MKNGTALEIKADAASKLVCILKTENVMVSVYTHILSCELLSSNNKVILSSVFTNNMHSYDFY